MCLPPQSRHWRVSAPRGSLALPFYNPTHLSPRLCRQSLCLTPGNHWSVLHFQNVVISKMLYNWNHRVDYFWGSISFSARHNSLEIHLYCMCQQFMPFDCWAVLRGKGVPQFKYLPGSSLWFLVLFLYKVLLAHSYDHLFTFCLQLLCRVEQLHRRPYGPQPKIFPVCSFIVEVWQPVFCVLMCTNVLNC